MRYAPGSSLRAKSVAKALQAALAAEGVERIHSHCLDIASRMFGYRGWQDLHATVDTEPRGPSDDEVAPEVLAERRRIQIGVLTGEGVSHSAAARILDGIDPTGAGSARPSDRGLSTESIVVRMRTPEAVVDLLGELAAHMVATFPDLALFDTQWDGRRWHLVVANKSGLAITDDGRIAMANYIVQPDLVDISDPRAILEFMSRHSDDVVTDDLWFVLDKFGIRKAVLERSSGEITGADAVYGVLQRLDPEILSLSRATGDISDEFYNLLAELKVGRPEFIRFLKEVPALFKLFLKDLDSDTRKRPLFDATVASRDVVGNFCEHIADGKCPASEVRRVVEALKGLDYRDRFAIYDFTLRVLAWLPPSAFPRTEADFRAMGKRVDHCDALVRQGMSLANIYRGLNGSDWVSFEEEWAKYGFSGLSVGKDLPSALLVAFANDVGRPIRRSDGLINESFVKGVHEEVAGMLMPRVFEAHSGLEFFAAGAEWYEGLREIEFLEGSNALVLASPLLPASLRGVGAVEILERLGFDPAAVARHLIR